MPQDSNRVFESSGARHIARMRRKYALEGTQPRLAYGPMEALLAAGLTDLCAACGPTEPTDLAPDARANAAPKERA